MHHTPRSLYRPRALATFAALLLAASSWFVLVQTARPALALSNGLAATPPMGWNDWNAYGCNVSETLVKQTADKSCRRDWLQPDTST